MAGDIVGSVAVRGASNPASSVIMAYWPGTGFSLENIDSTTMRVGVVQYYLKHSITMTYGDSVDTSAARTFPHLFCYIHWKKVHPQAMWCGVSATISSELIETPDACSFLSVQRICYRCAHAYLKMDFSTHQETVLVTCPILLKYSL